jgi:hypothetical protein
VDPTIRLRIATRIHFALLRHYDEDVAVSVLLKGEGDAREALWVCEASGHDDLITLAKQFKTANRQEARAVELARHAAKAEGTARGAVPQELAWSQNTSGFGLTRPLEVSDTPAAAAKPAGWLSPSRWLGLGR